MASLPVIRKGVYGGIVSGDRFWEGSSLTPAKKYDLAQVGRVIVGGDGACWVRNGAELLGGIYRLDRFRLGRVLHRTVDNGLALEVCQACIKGGVDKVDRILTQAQQRATGLVLGGKVKMRQRSQTRISQANILD